MNTTTAKILAACVLTLLALSRAYCNLGEDSAQISARYGAPVSGFAKPAYLVRSYQWRSYDIVVHFLNGKSASEMFQKPGGAGFSDDEIAKLLAEESEGQTWKPTGEELHDPYSHTWDRADGDAHAYYYHGPPPQITFDTPAFSDVMRKEIWH